MSTARIPQALLASTWSRVLSGDGATAVLTVFTALVVRRLARQRHRQTLGSQLTCLLAPVLLLTRLLAAGPACVEIGSKPFLPLASPWQFYVGRQVLLQSCGCPVCGSKLWYSQLQCLEQKFAHAGNVVRNISLETSVASTPIDKAKTARKSLSGRRAHPQPQGTTQWENASAAVHISKCMYMQS